MMNKPPYFIEQARDFEAVDSLPDCARRRARSGPFPHVPAPSRLHIFLFARDTV
jgi:hypothetical protein